MKYKPTIICLIMLIIFAIGGVPFFASADQTHIEVNVPPPEGMADEIIRLKEYERRIREEDRRQFKEELKQLSEDALRVGNLYIENGEYDAAVYYLEKAVYFAPSNAAAHERLVDATRLRNEKEKAIGSHYHKALHYYRQGMKQKAIDELVIAIQKNPDNEAARIKLNEIEADSRQ